MTAAFRYSGGVMRAGLWVVLTFSVALAGCASQMPTVSPSSHAASNEGASSQRATRTAARTRPATRAPVERAEAYAPWQAEPVTGTVGRSPADAVRTDAGLLTEAERREDERVRRLMMICANCGMRDR